MLLVLDIDNTVMSMDTDLGSDHWFEWQNYLLDNEPTSPHLVAKTFPELLKAQGILYDRGTMHPTQPEEPKLIGDLQKQGVATILLTSRGPEFRERHRARAETMRLRFQGIAHCPCTMCRRRVSSLRSGASGKERICRPTSLRITNWATPRPVLYTNGIFMTAGQHKGHDADDAAEKIAARHQGDRVRGRQRSPRRQRVFSGGRAKHRNFVVPVPARRHDVQRFQYGDKADMDAEWAAIKDGGKVVSVAKPEAEKPALQVERAPSARDQSANDAGDCFHGCR